MPPIEPYHASGSHGPVIRCKRLHPSSPSTQQRITSQPSLFSIGRCNCIRGARYEYVLWKCSKQRNRKHCGISYVAARAVLCVGKLPVIVRALFLRLLSCTLENSIKKDGENTMELNACIVLPHLLKFPARDSSMPWHAMQHTSTHSANITYEEARVLSVLNKLSTSTPTGIRTPSTDALPSR
jgi:hypothetical protein